jgi:fumarylacetoacetate (FAA) hydrolase
VFVPRETAVPLWEAALSAPIPAPPSLRDFYAFERHVRAGYESRGRNVPAAWYEVPVFYFGHTGNLFGPDEGVPRPSETEELDFELELAAVIGRAGTDIAAADAWDYVAGFTVMNDWSARDIQRQEMSVGLGPAKGKDFATSFGPVLLTIDEVRDRMSDERIDLAMTARINDEEVSRDSSASMHWGFPWLIERASRHVELRPGDIIGSGTCGTGCLLELGTDVHPWLQSGDEIELEIERIGRLRSVIV